MSSRGFDIDCVTVLKLFILSFGPLLCSAVWSGALQQGTPLILTTHCQICGVTAFRLAMGVLHHLRRCDLRVMLQSFQRSKMLRLLPWAVIFTGALSAIRQ